MEFKVAELKNREKVKPVVEGLISYKNMISEDILDVEDCSVKGSYKYIKEKDGFLFHLTIKTVITAPCVLTLEPTKVLVDFDTDLFYTFKVVDDDSFLITDNIVKFDEVIWGEIILNMPVRVVSPGATFHQDDYYEIDKDNPFSSLSEK